MNFFYTIIGLCTFFLVSCASEPVITEQVIAPIPIVKGPIDSTSYYDSVFAPNAYKIDTFFQRRFDERTFNGTVLYAKGNHTILKKAYGFSTLETKDSLTTKSTFQLASASKPFTAEAAARPPEIFKVRLTSQNRHNLIADNALQNMAMF